jgi:hypothetical protein
VIENPRTGEHIEFLSDAPDALVMSATWTRVGHRALEHVHPGMEERWHVLEGRAAFRIDGVEVEATAGSVVVAPPGRRHLAWNPTDAPSASGSRCAPPCGGGSSRPASSAATTPPPSWPSTPTRCSSRPADR